MHTHTCILTPSHTGAQTRVPHRPPLTPCPASAVQSKVRELEEKCRTQSEQFSLLSQDLERLRQHAGRIDLLGGGPGISLDVPASGKPFPPFMNGLTPSIGKGECVRGREGILGVHRECLSDPPAWDVGVPGLQVAAGRPQSLRMHGAPAPARSTRCCRQTCSLHSSVRCGCRPGPALRRRETEALARVTRGLAVSWGPRGAPLGCVGLSSPSCKGSGGDHGEF